MAYVDTLSRNPSVMDNSDRRREEIDILHVDITQDDWVLSSETKEKQCKEIMDILSKSSTLQNKKLMHSFEKILTPMHTIHIDHLGLCVKILFC